METKIDIYEKITQRIIQDLENKIVPWQKPWKDAQTINYVSRKSYRGINWLLLTAIGGGEFLTFKQMTDCGGKFIKDAKGKGLPVVFWKFTEYETKDKGSDGQNLKKVVPFVKYSTVFNINLTDLKSKVAMNCNTENKDYEFEYCKTLPINNQNASDRAFYSIKNHEITMPMVSQFSSVNEYYKTLYHEMIHSTGVKLGRDMSGKFYDTNSNYSFEELVAEIGSAMLSCYKQLDVNHNNTVSYIDSWLRELKNDKNLIIKASSAAQKAVDYILSLEPNHVESEDIENED